MKIIGWNFEGKLVNGIKCMDRITSKLRKEI